MATNDIKAFAVGSGANVLSQSEYLALGALVSGFTSGKANSKEVNKAIRQATFVAAALAQFVSDQSSVDVLDDGNVPGLASKIQVAVNGAGRLINVQTFSASGTYTPTAGTKSIIVEAIGAGGASGNLVATTATTNAISAAGSNGAYAKARYTSGFSSVVVTIGAGGVVNGGGGGGGNGGDGGATTFGALLTCPGGKGSLVGTAKSAPFNQGAAQPSAAPTGSGIIISAKGPYSTWPTVVALGQGSNFINSIPAQMGSYGLGGDGVVSDVSVAAKSGIAGAAGCVIVWEYA